MKTRKSQAGTDDAQIDSYLEAQLVADIRAAKNAENRKFVPVAISSKPKSIGNPKGLTGNQQSDQPEQYEFLEETDDGLPSN